MAKKPSVTTVSSGFASNTQLNSNFTALRDAFDNTLSLDGSTPNAMQADLDLNGNALLNVGTIDADNLTLNGQTVVDLASIPEWRSNWATATSYIKNDLVKTNGNVYICLVSHTSSSFAADLSALKWELFVVKGTDGAGSGDLVSTNNLSDVSNAATARQNLGITTLSTGSAILPSGTTAQRDGTPLAGYFRFNTTLGVFEGYNGSAWSGVGGATGAGGNQVFYENDQTVTANYTITNGKNAMSAGPITINSGVTVTVGSGEVWTII